MKFVIATIFAAFVLAEEKEEKKTISAEAEKACRKQKEAGKKKIEETTKDCMSKSREFKVHEACKEASKPSQVTNKKAYEKCMMGGASYIVLGTAATATIAALF